MTKLNIWFQLPWNGNACSGALFRFHRRPLNENRCEDKRLIYFSATWKEFIYHLFWLWWKALYICEREVAYFCIGTKIKVVYHIIELLCLIAWYSMSFRFSGRAPIHFLGILWPNYFVLNWKTLFNFSKVYKYSCVF